MPFELKYPHLIVTLGAFLIANAAFADYPSADCVGVIDGNTTENAISQKCGKPARLTGFGFSNPEWNFSDGSSLRVTTAGGDKQILRAVIVKPDKTFNLLYERHNQASDRTGNQGDR